jgi:hypothetical protein
MDRRRGSVAVGGFAVTAQNTVTKQAGDWTMQLVVSSTTFWDSVTYTP